MEAPIHGHAVMEMMIESGKVYTEETLRADMIEKFGSAARFYTCSASNMTADELIAFLQDQGKFVAGAGGFQTDRGRICDH